MTGPAIDVTNFDPPPIPHADTSEANFVENDMRCWRDPAEIFNTEQWESVEGLPRLHVPVASVVGHLYGKKFLVLLDTGATANVISKNTYADYFKRYPLLPLTSHCLNVDGSKSNAIGLVWLQVGLAGQCWKDSFLVIDGFPHPVLLGRSTLKQKRIDIMNSNNFAELTDSKGKTRRLPLISTPPTQELFESAPLVLLADLTLPPRHETVVQVQLDPPPNANPFHAYVTSLPAITLDLGVYVAKGVVKIDSGMTCILLSNLSTETRQLKAGQPIAQLHSYDAGAYAEVDLDLTTQTPEAEAVFVTIEKLHAEHQGNLNWTDVPKDVQIGIASDLSDAQLQQILDLLQGSSELFATPSIQSQINPVDATHTIELTSTKVPHEPPRRHSPKHRQIIRDSIATQLGAGVIRPSRSPYASAIVLIPKKNTGEMRFCVDYRKLNQITKKDVYPLPRIDDAFDALGGSNYFSVFDLKSGYWQIPIAEADKEKTAFTSHEGLFEYNVMPFGLTNAPATFQRLMDVVLSGLKWQSCLVYLDDIVVFSKTFTQHIDDIRRVFDRLKQHRLRLNGSKCHICCKQIIYLGHSITPDGIKADPAKLDAIRKFPIPQTVADLERFLGFSGYYRRFIENYAMIAAPLHDLTKKAIPWSWTLEHQQAFDSLRDKLIADPVLALPDFSRDVKFKLQTDASDIGIGAVLCQEDACKRERVLAYASRKLTALELKWHTQEKEALAIVWACETFRHYLVGDEFVVESDHSSLQWLQSATKGRLARWALRLSEFDYQIRHKAGKKNANADALSRAPVNSPTLADEGDGRFDEVYMINTTTPSRYPTRATTRPTNQSVLERALAFKAKANLDPDPIASSTRMRRFNRQAIGEPHKAEPPISCADHIPIPSNTADSSTSVSVEISHDEEMRPQRKSTTSPQAATVLPQQSDEVVDNDTQTAADAVAQETSTQLQQFVKLDVSEMSLRETIRESQHEDVDMVRIKHLLNHSPDEKPAMVGKWPYKTMAYSVTDDGLVFRKYIESRATRAVHRQQLLIPASIRMLILENFHDSPLCGHLGRDRTYVKMRERFYWPNMKNSISTYIQHCLPCTLSKRRVNLYNRPLQPTRPDGPFAKVCIDLVGPFPQTADGKKYICCITDFFTKWVEAVPLNDKHSSSVADAIYKQLICRHGVPKTILTDQGSEFTNSMMQRIADRLKVTHKVTTAYYPQANGLVERFNKTLVDGLTAYQTEEPHVWDMYLDGFLFAYRTSQHTATNETPFYLLYGRDARLPVDIIHGGLDDILDDVNTHQIRLTYDLRRAHDIVRTSIKAVGDEYKRRWDLKGPHRSFNVGDQVLLYTPKGLNKSMGIPPPSSHNRDGPTSRKLDVNWSGPWEVIEQKHESVYRIRHANGHERTVNVNKLDEYVSPLIQRKRVMGDGDRDGLRDGAISQRNVVGSESVSGYANEALNESGHSPEASGNVRSSRETPINDPADDAPNLNPFPVNPSSISNPDVRTLPTDVSGSRDLPLPSLKTITSIQCHRRDGKLFRYTVTWSNADSPSEVSSRFIRPSLLKQYWKTSSVPDLDKPVRFQQTYVQRRKVPAKKQGTAENTHTQLAD
ncbi:hypothetical protein SeLEV6574_g00360 [Synchytrium endobioticum]|uniref:RNA-directed DNA polymerase n=1 Tax=Synchytrium endobioticum TaxID=286115 RepID=A0A507DHV0_9FUNG|nr:hypothetical protein SeLEV6574_g00360 [Synchytrium endobioticum]